MRFFHIIVATACLVPVHGCAGTPTGPRDLELPAELRSCETNTARLCTTWELVNGRYEAAWSNGSTAEIEVVRFAEDVVVFERRDTGGPTDDMHAFYYGLPEGERITAGAVVWNTGGLTFEGLWEAAWGEGEL